MEANALPPRKRQAVARRPAASSPDTASPQEKRVSRTLRPPASPFEPKALATSLNDAAHTEGTVVLAAPQQDSESSPPSASSGSTSGDIILVGASIPGTCAVRRRRKLPSLRPLFIPTRSIMTNHRGLRYTLLKWRDSNVVEEQLLGFVTRARRHAQHQSFSWAWSTWCGHSQQHEQRRRQALRATRRLQHWKLAPAFHTWCCCVCEADASTRKLRRAASRLLSRQLCLAWETWCVQIAGAHQLRWNLLPWLHRECAIRFRAWRAHTIRLVEASRLLRMGAARLRKHSVAVAWTQWRRIVADELRALGELQKCASRFCQLRVREAINTWIETVRTLRQLTSVLHRAMAHQLVFALSKWSDYAVRQSSTMSVLDSAASSWRDSQRRTACKLWVAYCAQRTETLATLWKAASAHIARAWNQWRQHASLCASREARLANCIVRMLNCHLSAAWNTWQHGAAQWANQCALLHSYASRLRLRRVSMPLQSWMEYAARCRGMISTLRCAVENLACRTVRRALDTWALTSRQLSQCHLFAKRISSARSGRALLAWKSVSHFMAQASSIQCLRSRVLRHWRDRQLSISWETWSGAVIVRAGILERHESVVSLLRELRRRTACNTWRQTTAQRTNTFTKLKVAANHVWHRHLASALYLWLHRAAQISSARHELLEWIQRERAAAWRTWNSFVGQRSLALVTISKGLARMRERLLGHAFCTMVEATHRTAWIWSAVQRLRQHKLFSALFSWSSASGLSKAANQRQEVSISFWEYAAVVQCVHRWRLACAYHVALQAGLRHFFITNATACLMHWQSRCLSQRLHREVAALNQRSILRLSRQETLQNAWQKMHTDILRASVMLRLRWFISLRTHQHQRSAYGSWLKSCHEHAAIRAMRALSLSRGRDRDLYRAIHAMRGTAHHQGQLYLSMTWHRRSHLWKAWKIWAAECGHKGSLLSLLGYNPTSHPLRRAWATWACATSRAIVADRLFAAAEFWALKDAWVALQTGVAQAHVLHQALIFASVARLIRYFTTWKAAAHELERLRVHRRHDRRFCARRMVQRSDCNRGLRSVSRTRVLEQVARDMRDQRLLRCVLQAWSQISRQNHRTRSHEAPLVQAAVPSNAFDMLSPSQRKNWPQAWQEFFGWQTNWRDLTLWLHTMGIPISDTPHPELQQGRIYAQLVQLLVRMRYYDHVDVPAHYNVFQRLKAFFNSEHAVSILGGRWRAIRFGWQQDHLATLTLLRVVLEVDDPSRWGSFVRSSLVQTLHERHQHSAEDRTEDDGMHMRLACRACNANLHLSGAHPLHGSRCAKCAARHALVYDGVAPRDNAAAAEEFARNRSTLFDR